MGPLHTGPGAPYSNLASVERYAAAVEQDRMITQKESVIRRSMGAVWLAAFAWQAYLMFSTGSTTLTRILDGTVVTFLGNGYILLSVLAGSAYGFWETGRQSL
mmetsp:Transcript_50756/g.90280  ORF Transcript_50756/g.90280 Transcript_50756/m.90280 type:complete len:103 (-) Transcript_50756:96-404(-)